MDLRTILPSLADAIGSLTPSLVGSALSQSWKPGLPWGQRFVQWIVGSTVSFYATRFVIELTGWGDFAAQSIAFGIALFAYDATPRLAKAASDTLANVPGRLLDFFLPKKD